MLLDRFAAKWFQSESGKFVGKSISCQALPIIMPLGLLAVLFPKLRYSIFRENLFNVPPLKQVEMIKYLGIAFTSVERQDEELDVRSGKASAVMRALHQSVVLKPELSRNTKLLVFKSIFISILIYGHESWVMTERVRSHMQASELRFLQTIKVVTMFDKLCNTAAIREFLNFEWLLLRIKRPQLRWFSHVCRMSQERLHKQTLNAKVS